MEHPEFAERFNLAVQRAGVKDTQDALSRLLGVSPVTIWSYRTGTKLPRMSTAQRIAHKLGVSTEWLLDGTGRGPSDLPEGVKEVLPEVTGEASATYQTEAKALPQEAIELITLISRETTAGNLRKEHLKLLLANIKLMTAKN